MHNDILSLSMHLALTLRCLLFFLLHSNYSVHKGHSDILCRKRLRKTHPNYSPFTACHSPLKTENESKRKKERLVQMPLAILLQRLLKQHVNSEVS